MPILNKVIKFVITRSKYEQIFIKNGYEILKENSQKFVYINQLDLVKILPNITSAYAKLECTCDEDNCGKTFFKTPHELNKCNTVKCKKHNIEDACLKHYGVRHNFQAKQVREKIESTMIEKYGAAHPMKCEEIKERVQKTNLERYGTKCSFSNKDVQAKFRENNLKKYGVDHPMKLKYVKEKVNQTMFNRYGTREILSSPKIREQIKATNLEKYGCENPMQNDDIKNKAAQTYLSHYGKDVNPQGYELLRNKIEQTCLERYSCEHVFQNKEIQEKSRQTCRERYGTDYAIQNDDILEKLKNTNLDRYGIPYILQREDIHSPEMIAQNLEKSHQTMYQHGTVKTSRQQIYLNNLLGGTLNLPIKYWNGDICFENEKIVLEYNGSGHNLAIKLGGMTEYDAYLKSVKRNKGLYSEGWKLITFISDTDELPNDNDIVLIFEFCKNYLLTTSHHWIDVNFNTNEILCNAFETTIDDIKRRH